MAGRLEAKVAIITGAGTGIGEAIAHKFSLEGAKILICGFVDDPLDDVAENIRKKGGEVEVYKGDISDERNAGLCVEAAVKAFGKLDILVNNAGVFPEINETQDFSLEAFEKLFQHNCRTVFLMTKFALPHLQKSRGNIVTAGSEAGFNGIMQMTPYGGTKAWNHAFMKGVAVEQAKYGVRANCVCPGPIDTAWTHADEGPMTKKMEKTVVASTPLGRRGSPEEIANVYAFLASDEASYVTGALWLADGGITIAHGNIGDETPSKKTEPREEHLRLRHSHDGRPDKVMH